MLLFPMLLKLDTLKEKNIYKKKKEKLKKHEFEAKMYSRIGGVNTIRPRNKMGSQITTIRTHNRYQEIKVIQYIEIVIKQSNQDFTVTKVSVLEP